MGPGHGLSPTHQVAATIRNFGWHCPVGCPGQQHRIPPPRAAAPKKGTTAEERESCSGKWVMAVPRAYPVGFTPPQSQTALFKAVLNNPAVLLELGPRKATSARNSTQKSFPYFAPSACPWHLYSFVPGLSAHQGESWCANQAQRGFQRGTAAYSKRDRPPKMFLSGSFQAKWDFQSHLVLSFCTSLHSPEITDNSRSLLNP